MALYPKAIKKLITPGANDPRIRPRVVVLHVAAGESSSLYPYFNGPSGGVESHFYIRRDGTVEQYRDTDWQADANMAANDFGISVETQGLGAGEWTTQQLAALRDLIRWCHTVHDIPIAKCVTWNGRGVGYHSQFTQWAGDGRTCPGPDRIKQIPALITSAAGGDILSAPAPKPAPVEDDMFTDNDRKLLQDTLKKADGSTLRRDLAWQNNLAIANQRALVAAITALSSTQGLDPAKVEQILKDSVAEALSNLRITSDGTDA